MKLVSFLNRDKGQAGLLMGDNIYELSATPVTMQYILDNWDESIAAIKTVAEMGASGRVSGIPVHAVPLLAPVPHPTSCRDGYAFRQHVASARRNRKVPMTPEFDQYPVFILPITIALSGREQSNACPIIFTSWILSWKQPSLSAKKGAI